MKYMLLAYTKQADFSQIDVTSPEFLAMCEFYANLGRELTESGELVLTEGLADPSLTRTVHPAADGPVASDGPYAEAKEVLVRDRKSTRLNSSHVRISYAVFCLK